MAEYVLEGKGLRPGEYDFLIARMISEGAVIYGYKEELLRVSLCMNTTWEKLLNVLPKGSIIKNVRRAQ